MDSKRTIFIHIPKTGGTSILSFLEFNFAKNELFSIAKLNRQLFGSKWGEIPYFEREAKAKKYFSGLSNDIRNNYKIIYGHMDYGWHEVVDNAEYVTFLREPVGRVLSLYYYILRRETLPLSKQIKEEEISIDDFVQNQMHPEASNGITKRLCGDDFNALDLEDSFEIAKNRLLNFKYVGFMDNFDSSMLNFADIIDANNLYYLRSNTTKKKVRQTTNLELIKDLNKYDIKLYEEAKLKFGNMYSVKPGKVFNQNRLYLKFLELRKKLRSRL